MNLPWRYRCKNCDSVSIYQRRGGHDRRDEYSHFKCEMCGEKIDECYDAYNDVYVPVGKV